MSKQVFEKIKRLFEKLFQTKRPSKNEKESWTLWSVGGTVLRTLKLLSNVFFVFVLLGCLFGGGIALGYGARIFDKVETPKKEEFIKKIQDISTISELKYADGSSISAIDSDLLRVPIKSKDISDNVKKAVIATEDENFRKHNGVVTKAVLRATLGSVVGIGSSSGGST